LGGLAAIAILLFLQIGSTRGSGPCDLFDSGPQYSLTSPWSLAVDHLRPGGNLDLVLIDRSSEQVLVFLGNGDGSFEDPQPYAAGAYPLSVAVGDFVGDGNLDLAVANYVLAGDGTVSVLKGKGDGTFATPPFAYAAGPSPVALVAGDFTGDGLPDLAVGNSVSYTLSQVSVLVRDEDGGFSSSVVSPSGVPPGLLTAAYIDGDANLDLVVAPGTAGDTRISVLFGNGDGSFDPPVLVVAGPFYPSSVAVGHFNPGVDDYPDLAVANAIWNGTVSVLLGLGARNFQDPVPYQVGPYTACVAVEDVNDDTVLDIVSANQGPPSISVLLGNGDGTFQPAVGCPVGSAAIDLVTGDFNNDLRPDLAIASRLDSLVSILLAIPPTDLPPIITCPADILVPCSIDVLVPVTYEATATDDTDPSPTITYSIEPGSGFAVGTTPVTCTATDTGGNSSSCTFNVIRAALNFDGFYFRDQGAFADSTGGSYESPCWVGQLPPPRPLNLPPVIEWPAGAQILVSFSLSCEGAVIDTGVHTLKVINGATGDSLDAASNVNPGNMFVYSPVLSKWTYLLSTAATGMSPGVWRVEVRLSDGSQHSAWIKLVRAGGSLPLPRP